MMPMMVEERAAQVADLRLRERERFDEAARRRGELARCQRELNACAAEQERLRGEVSRLSGELQTHAARGQQAENEGHALARRAAALEGQS
jgi:hypothetical protein